MQSPNKTHSTTQWTHSIAQSRRGITQSTHVFYTADWLNRTVKCRTRVLFVWCHSPFRGTWDSKWSSECKTKSQSESRNYHSTSLFKQWTHSIAQPRRESHNQHVHSTLWTSWYWSSFTISCESHILTPHDPKQTAERGKLNCNLYF